MTLFFVFLGQVVQRFFTLTKSLVEDMLSEWVSVWTQVLSPTKNKVIRRRDLGLKSHPKDRRSRGRSCYPWIGGLACYPLQYRRSDLLSLTVLTKSAAAIFLFIYYTIHIYIIFLLLKTWKELLHCKSFSHCLHGKKWYCSCVKYVLNFNVSFTNDIVRPWTAQTRTALILYVTETKIAEFANKVDLDEPPDLGLHCLPSSLWILNMIYLEIFFLKICRREFCRVLLIIKSY